MSRFTPGPCTVKEKLSGHLVDCCAPQWLEVIAKAEGVSSPCPHSFGISVDPDKCEDCFRAKGEKGGE